MGHASSRNWFSPLRLATILIALLAPAGLMAESVEKTGQPAAEPLEPNQAPRRTLGAAPSPSAVAPHTADPLAAAVARDPNLAIVPGQTVQPIDLGNVLRLAGARDLDIAIARQRVDQAVADLSRARALWLPSLFLGPTWYRADGHVQTVTGQVVNVNRSSLFVGGQAATANGFVGPSPGTGFPPLNGMTSVLRFSDAIYEPMAARRDAAASRARVVATTNDALLTAAEAYFDLQVAAGQLAIAREAAANAEALAEITLSYAQTGQGKTADYRRARAEFQHQRKVVQLGIGQLQVASTNLVRLLVLDPKLLLAPVEPAESIVRMIPDDVPMDDLIIQGLRNRPELARSQELVQAAIVRYKQARMRPFIPSLGLTYSGGGFGGGAKSYFGDFNIRGDAAASLFWELQNLGFSDLAIARRRGAERRVADLELVQVETRVTADVASAYETRAAALRQITESTATVTEAVESVKLNFLDIREGANLPRATRPIEVLQPIQALAQARNDYLDSVLTYNRAQFRLKRAIGQQP